MIISAYLGVASLGDVGYQFFDSSEAASGSRVTAGIVDAGEGWYSADATLPSNSISVRWNSAGTATAVAREYYRSLGDPWIMDVPDGYPAGSAGKILGDNLNAQISSRLAPTTAGRTLDVTATGEAAIDLDNTTGTLAKGTDIVGFNDIAAGAAMTLTSAYDAAKTAAQAGTAMTLTSGERTTLAGVIWGILTSTLTVAGSIGKWIVDSLPGIAPGSVGGLLRAGSNVGTITMNITGDLVGNVTGDVQGSVHEVINPDSIAAGVRDVSNATPAAGSLGEDVKTAAAGGGGGGADPWLTALPGAYGAGTAGKILGERLDVLVSSRLAGTSYTVPPTATENATATRDIDNSSPPAGSLGDKINNAASAGDPWGTILPGSYAPGSAGDLIGSNLDATISSRLITTDYVVPPSAVQVSEAVRDVNNLTPAVNSLGAMIKVDADLGDPWAVALPGAYGTGSAGKIVGDNLDAKVSTRSTYNGSDTAGTTTLLSRIASVLNITSGKVDVNDKTNFSLTSAYDAAKTAAQPGAPMTLTPGERTTLTAEIWNTLTSALTFAGSIGKWILDKLDVPVGSRLASASYVAPDNAGITAIKVKTDTLPANPAAVSDIPTASQNAVAARDVNNTNPAPLSLGADVKTGAAAGDPWGINLPGSYAPGSAGNIVGTRIDTPVSSRLAASDIALNAGAVTVGTNNDKAGYNLAPASEDAIARAILTEDWQGIAGEPAYCVLNALRFVCNCWEVKPDGTLVVYKENSTDIAWTRSVTVDETAKPIVAVC